MTKPKPRTITDRIIKVLRTAGHDLTTEEVAKLLPEVHANSIGPALSKATERGLIRHSRIKAPGADRVRSYYGFLRVCERVKAADAVAPVAAPVTAVAPVAVPEAPIEVDAELERLRALEAAYRERHPEDFVDPDIEVVRDIITLVFSTDTYSGSRAVDRYTFDGCLNAAVVAYKVGKEAGRG